MLPSSEDEKVAGHGWWRVPDVEVSVFELLAQDLHQRPQPAHQQIAPRVQMHQSHQTFSHRTKDGGATSISVLQVRSRMEEM